MPAKKSNLIAKSINFNGWKWIVYNVICLEFSCGAATKRYTRRKQWFLTAFHFALPSSNPFCSSYLRVFFLFIPLRFFSCNLVAFYLNCVPPFNQFGKHCECFESIFILRVIFVVFFFSSSDECMKQCFWCFSPFAHTKRKTYWNIFKPKDLAKQSW